MIFNLYIVQYIIEICSLLNSDFIILTVSENVLTMIGAVN